MRSERKTAGCVAILLVVGTASCVRPAPGSPGDLAPSGRARAERGLGVARRVVEPPTPPDGTGWYSFDTVVLGGREARLVVEFDQPVTARALTLQADAGDVYVVESSTDGRRWEPLWTVEPVADRTGLLTRHRVLESPLSTRGIRVHAREGDGLYFVGALKIYEEPWAAPPPDIGRPAAATWPSRESIGHLKLLLALSATVLLGVGLRRRRRRPGAPAPPRGELRVLVVLGLLAGLCWFNLFQYTSRNYDETFQNYWDVYHYYFGSKYSPELGYTRLYRCTVVADMQDGFDGLSGFRNVRDLETNRVERRIDAAACLPHFTDERWLSFKRDLEWFRSRLSPRIWTSMLMDHGYNATPTWGVVGRALSGWGAASDIQIGLLLAIDPLLLVTGWIVVWWAFGPWAAAIALVFWGTAFPARSWWTAGAFLRQDWLLFSLLGLALLRRRWMFSAGFALAWAALLRVFPALLLLGLLAKALVRMIEERRWLPARAHRRVLAGVLTAVVLGVPASLWVHGRTGVWQEFVVNSRKHVETPLSNYMGAKTIVRSLVGAGKAEESAHGSTDTEAEPAGRSTPWAGRLLVGGAAGLGLLLLVPAVRREEDWVAAALGVALLPLMTELTCYYYAVFAALGLLALRRPWIGPGLCALSVVFDVLRRMLADNYELYLWSSWAALVFALLALVTFAGGGTAPGSGRSAP